MKKSLLALAVLGAFAGAASAQSSVTIYGLIDVGITKGNGGSAGYDTATGPDAALNILRPGQETNPGANSNSKAWQVKQAAASRLGFRGNEDLGGGLSVQFDIQHRFDPDTGGLSSTAFWHGRSYVQLTSAAAGSVYLGRDYAPAFWPAVKTDPFGWDGVGQVGTAQYAGFRSASSSIRTANTVGYRSPNLGGLTIQLAVAPGEATVPRDVGGNLEYGAGPLYVGVGFEKLSGGPPVGAPPLRVARDGDSLFNIGAAYDFGVVRPVIYYARAKIGEGEFSNKSLMLALTAPIGPGKLKAAYSQVSWDDALGLEKSKHIGIGYDYPLSKRTNVYADFGRGAYSGLDNNTAYAFGIKHTF